MKGAAARICATQAAVTVLSTDRTVTRTGRPHLFGAACP